MSDLEPLASKKEERSFTLKELKKGVSNYSDGLKDAWESRDVSKFKKLEDNLKKKKEVLESKIDQKERIIRGLISTSTMFWVSTRNISHNPHYFFPNLTDFWANIFLVDAKILTTVMGITIVEEIIYQIINWIRRRNMTTKVSLENADEKNERIFFIATDYDHLMNRHRKLIKDLNENYGPMRNLYKRRLNQYAINSFVLFFVVLTVFIPFAIEILYYQHTALNLQRTLFGFILLFFIISLPISLYLEISEYKKFQF